MKTILKTTCLIVAIGIFGQAFSDDLESSGAIQIVAPVNHSFQLELNEFKSILEADDIKDRHVVVVSIAGAFRKGKSFLLNFFLRYLNAQYKSHNVSDWIGENSNETELNGFKWRGGRKPETTGIYMWSEIFTHDFENGEKVAIILLDTQGIFDSRTSIQECTSIFALSMMLSSIQCYNVMQNIQEDDLQHLELFTEYARLALEQTNEKPFQYLLFLVRDWPFAYEIDYGWQGQQVIDELLTGDMEQTPEMRQLRSRINSSFDEIGAFLMPHPGFQVTQAKNFNGNLKEIDPNFVKYIKELVPALFAPENLVVKKINGQTVQAKDLVHYLQKYIEVFNGNTLPEAKTVLIVTAEANNLILHNDCLQFYTDAMKKFTDSINSYATQNELNEMHFRVKDEAIEKFLSTPKLGGDEIASSFLYKLDDATEEKFLTFQQENEQKRQIFIETSNLYNTQLNDELEASFETEFLKELGTESNLRSHRIISASGKAKLAALERFNDRKAGDDEIAAKYREKLQISMEKFLANFNSSMIIANNCTRFYADSMKRSVQEVATYFYESELKEIHEKTKKKAILKLNQKLNPLGDKLMQFVQRRIENEIDKEFILSKSENRQKEIDYLKRATFYNDELIQEIKNSYLNVARNRIANSPSYLSDFELMNLLQSIKSDALRYFDWRKMGNDKISGDARASLDQSLNARLDSTLRNANDAKRNEHYKGMAMKAGGYGLAGAAVCSLFFGPVGITICAIGAGVAGGASSNYNIGSMFRS